MTAENFDLFLRAVFHTHESGGGTYLLLWLAVLALLLTVILLYRNNKKAIEAAVTDLTSRLNECEEEHGITKIERIKDEARYGKIQKKLAMTLGLLIANMGHRKLPEGFWQMVMDEDSEYIPSFDSSGPGIVPQNIKTE